MVDYAILSFGQTLSEVHTVHFWTMFGQGLRRGIRLNTFFYIQMYTLIREHKRDVNRTLSNQCLPNNISNLLGRELVAF